METFLNRPELKAAKGRINWEYGTNSVRFRKSTALPKDTLSLP